MVGGQTLKFAWSPVVDRFPLAVIVTFFNLLVHNAMQRLEEDISIFPRNRSEAYGERRVIAKQEACCFSVRSSVVDLLGISL